MLILSDAWNGKAVFGSAIQEFIAFILSACILYAASKIIYNKKERSYYLFEEQPLIAGHAIYTVSNCADSIK